MPLNRIYWGLMGLGILLAIACNEGGDELSEAGDVDYADAGAQSDATFSDAESNSGDSTIELDIFRDVELDLSADTSLFLPLCANHDCDGHGTCLEADGRPVCQCEAGYESQGSHCRLSHQNGTSWTFLVYMIADNDLEPYAIRDVQEMMKVGSTSDLKIVLQIDRGDYSDESLGGIADFEDTRRFLVQNGSLLELANLGEMDMVAVSTLSAFINWGLSSYPSDRYALILWDHGDGIDGFGGDENPNYLEYMDLPEIQTTLLDGLSGTGVDHFDLIGFDACNMAMFEVMLAVEPYARYFLASEEGEPEHGWDYSVLSEIASNPAADGQALGSALLHGYVQQAKSPRWDDFEYITLSLIDLSYAEAMSIRINNLAQTLSVQLDDAYPAIEKALEKTIEYGYDYFDRAYFFDLFSLLQNILANYPEMTPLWTPIEQLFPQLVLDNAYGDEMEGSAGIAIYFPEKESRYNSDYEDLPGVDKWRDLMKAYWER